MNHALLPNVANATLPGKYEAAKIALKECHSIDECKDWGDKMEAMASYARQADDDEMEKIAIRIRARAVRRCGELFKEIEKNVGGRPKKTSIGADTSFSRIDAAEQAGMSKRQMTTSIRIANIPEEDFEKQIEGDKPPTMTALAEQGKKNGTPLYARLGMSKKAFQAGTYFQGALRDMVKETQKYDLQDIIDGSTPEDRKEMIRNIHTLDAFLDQLVVKL